MKELYFIRHGVSEGNLAGIWSGRTNTPLSTKGHQQADKAAQTAKKDGVIFDLIISSPLDRALHTAQYIAKAQNYAIENIMVDDRLIERSFGSLEGRTDRKISALYRLDETSIDHIDGVEKIADLQIRANEVLKFIHSLPQNRILVVAHGSFGRALRRAVNNTQPEKPVVGLPHAEIIKFI